jgi:hypothetical protein
LLDNSHGTGAVASGTRAALKIAMEQEQQQVEKKVAPVGAAFFLINYWNIREIEAV